ncbi:MAG: serine O-acetyltransferase [Deltaproteobacteria bacterium RBG_13_52_11]|nr:MAG: serine O-acetyltransferase [Deltaproteobacteria bacterium RBG_13_52_11]
MFRRFREDVRMVFERDPAARSIVEVIFCYPGLHALWLHRLAHVLWNKRLFFIARFLSHINRLITGVEVHPGAKIGRRFFIDHGAGVVIGETSEIGDDVTIYQGVVLGGVSVKKGKRHPTIGNKVVVGAGGIILGPVHIGEGCQIGAGSVVVTDIPPYTTAIGIPAKPAGRHLIKEPVDLNHHLIPDPVKEVIDQLARRVAELEEQLVALSEGKGRTAPELRVKGSNC